jgi:DNA-binding beta-propeller fold protein YncE
MRVGEGANTYEWVEDWAKIPATESARSGWAHHGVVVSEAGDVISFHQQDGTVLVFDGDGNLKRSWDSGVTEGHGMTLVKEGGTEYLWIADNGRKRMATQKYEYPDGDAQVTGRVVKLTLDGQKVMELQRPDIGVYRQGNYMPTWVAVHEERHGGNGDVWVADGYGESQVHRFDKAGAYIGTINGAEGEAGAFSCPHAILIDYRKSSPELYIADRSNGRIQVYDTEGRFKRAFGSNFFITPSGLVTYGDLMIVAELNARLTIIDIEDNLVCYVGDNSQVSSVDGWPNNKDSEGRVIPTKLLEAGKFNSPHGIAVDKDGNVFVAEWLIGGRFIKLAR